MADEPIVAGALAAHPDALAFARVVQRVHHRYAAEVVGAFSLCRFMNDPASAFGRFCVMLDRQLDVPGACEQVLAAPTAAGRPPEGVVHLVYPLFAGPSRAIERFGNALHEAVRREAFARHLDPPVHATFHPEMEGDTDSPPRLVGFLRRAPDPFVQFVPEGLAKGGTVFTDPASVDLGALLAQQQILPSPPQHAPGDLFRRLSRKDLDTIEQRILSIRADRDASYARYVDAF